MKNKVIIYITLLLFPTFIFSQETLIPYRVGKFWGLSDTNGKLILNAIYDSIKSIDYKIKFITYKNGKQGVIHNGVEILKPMQIGRLGGIQEQDNRFYIEQSSVDGNSTLGSSRQIIYNLKGEKIIDKPVRELKLIPFELKKNDVLYFTYGVNNDSELFIYDDNSQRIKKKLLTNKKGYLVFDYSNEKKEIKIYNFSEEGNQIYILKYNNAINQYEILKSNEKLKHLDFDYDDGTIKYSSYDEIKNNFAIKTIELVIDNNNIKQISKYKRDKESNIKIDTIQFKLYCDDFIIRKYTSKSGKELYEHGHFPLNKSELEKIDTVYFYRNYLTYTKNNKIGLLCENKLIEPQFTSVTYLNLGYIKPSFLVSKLNDQKEVKYGIVGANGKFIIPVKYDEIKINENGGYTQLLILKDHDKYGFALFDGTIIIEPQYDSIIPHRDYYSLNIMNNGKFGYFDINNVFSEPIFPQKIDFVINFNGTKVFKLIDENNKIIGFANFDGTLYFKD